MCNVLVENGIINIGMAWELSGDKVNNLPNFIINVFQWLFFKAMSRTGIKEIGWAGALSEDTPPFKP